MFNLILLTNQKKLLTHFQKVLSHNFTLDKCYPQKCSGNLKVTSTLFLMSSLSCPKHSTLPQHTYFYVNPLNNLNSYPTAPSLFTSHIRQSFPQMKLKIIREWRIHGNNGQEKAICILHINKLFQSAPSQYCQFYWRPSELWCSPFCSSHSSPEPEKFIFTDYALLSVWCSWRSKENIWSTLQM